MDMTSVLNGIIEYVLEHEPQTYTQLHERAQGKHWYTRDRFDKLMSCLARNAQISATVHGKEIVYKRKAVRAPRQPAYRPPCPPLIAGVNDGSHDVFGAMCFCYLFCLKGEADQMYDRQIRKEHKDSCYFYARNENTK